MVNKLLTAAVAFACILLGYMLYTSLEFYEESVDAGWSFAAKRNPYLAAELLLRHMGAEIVSSDSKSALNRLDHFDSLLITNSALVVNQAMADQLLDWVAKGGELVIGANETRGKLLEQLDVDYKSVTYHYADGEEPLFGDRGWVAPNDLSPMQKALGEYGDDNNKKVCKKCDEDKTISGCEECANDAPAGKLEPQKKFSDLLKEANKKNHEKPLEQSTSNAGSTSNAESSSEASSNPEVSSTPEVGSNAEAKAQPGNVSSTPALASKPEKIPERRITRVKFNDYDQDVKAVFSPWSIITHPDVTPKTTHNKPDEQKESESDYSPFYWAGSQQGAHLMMFNIGDGTITVVSDASIWNSYQLARQDHALLLKSLGFRKTPLILYGIAMPSIMKLAWRKFPELITTLTLFIIFCLWRKAVRVGPLRNLDNSGRRSIMDSIAGLASYLHKRKKYSHLLQPLMAEILSLASRQISGFTHAEQAQKYLLLSDHSGLSQSAVARVMNPEAAQNDEAFQDTILLLQKIRKTL